MGATKAAYLEYLEKMHPPPDEPDDTKTKQEGRAMGSGQVHKSTKHFCVQCGSDDWSKEAGYWECQGCHFHLYADFNTDPHMRCHVCGYIHFKNQKQCPNCGLVREDDQL